MVSSLASPVLLSILSFGLGLERTEQELPSASIRETVANLMQDSSDVIVGPERYSDWARTVWEDARRVLGVDVKLPELVDIDPELGNGYSPGKVLMAFAGFTRFPRWASIATLLYEGIPGHHLQETVARQSTLIASTWRRRLLLAGYAEGWATFAERLAPLDEPGHRLGVKISWIARLGRAICDLGLHTDQPMPGGEAWSAGRARDFFVRRLALPEPVASNEVERILGRPAHSAAYALGARVWSRIPEPLHRIREGAMGIEMLERTGAVQANSAIGQPPGRERG